jgi:hypothetical protein
MHIVNLKKELDSGKCTMLGVKFNQDSLKTGGPQAVYTHKSISKSI